MARDQVRDRIDLSRRESAQLGQYLSGLPFEAVSKQSACDRWQVSDVVAHLTSTAEFQGGLISRGIAGDPEAPEWARQPSEGAPSPSERLALGAISLRQKLGDQLVNTFQAHYEELLWLLDGIKPEDYSKPCWHPWGPMPVSQFVNMVVLELAMHGWDIRSALDPDYHLNSDVLSVCWDLAPYWLQRVFQPGSRLPNPIRYRFELSDGASPRDVVLAGDAFQLEEPGTKQADVTFRCDTETYELLVFGRLPLAKAIAAGRLTSVGDRTAVDGLEQRFGRV